jgi:hypothetical protein
MTRSPKMAGMSAFERYSTALPSLANVIVMTSAIPAMLIYCMDTGNATGAIIT